MVIRLKDDSEEHGYQTISKLSGESFYCDVVMQCDPKKKHFFTILPPDIAYHLWLVGQSQSTTFQIRPNLHLKSWPPLER